MTTPKLVLQASHIVAEDLDLVDAELIVHEGRIGGLGSAMVVASDAPTVDLGAVTIIPGLIDIHIHGRENCDVMDADPASLRTISASLARHGVTGFLATTVTAQWQTTLDALATVAAFSDEPICGARVLGAYSEGLFFNCKHRGAHNEAFFLPPTVKRVDAMIAAADGHLKVLALAPEIDGAMDVLRHATAQGIRVVLGHTDADYVQTVEALQAGGRGGVHVFNGMRGLHHREPGCVGALLLEDATVEVIADGAHLHPAILDLVARLKTRDQVILISDCMCAGGMPDGTYRLGETDVTVHEGVARTPSGSLAGSTLTLDRAIERMTREAGVPFRDAVHMASLSPARFLGLGDELGSIANGKRADLTILDNCHRVVATFVDGRVVHLDPDWEAAGRLTKAMGGDNNLIGNEI